MNRMARGSGLFVPQTLQRASDKTPRDSLFVFRWRRAGLQAAASIATRRLGARLPDQDQYTQQSTTLIGGAGFYIRYIGFEVSRTQVLYMHAYICTACRKTMCQYIHCTTAQDGRNLGCIIKLQLKKID